MMLSNLTPSQIIQGTILEPRNICYSDLQKYKVNGSATLNKYPVYDAYLLDRTRDIRQNHRTKEKVRRCFRVGPVLDGKNKKTMKYRLQCHNESFAAPPNPVTSQIQHTASYGTCERNAYGVPKGQH